MFYDSKRNESQSSCNVVTESREKPNYGIKESQIHLKGKTVTDDFVKELLMQSK
jgi:hypothetical protein